MLIEILQNVIPLSWKNNLKRYFRIVYPNKLMALIWITFRCTYKCSYCPYCGLCDYSQVFKKNCEKSGEEWIEALKKLPPTSFYISGGEPFLYKDLPYILNNLPKKHSIIGIVTNASMPMDVYNRVNKKIHLNVSFHREFVSEDEFVSKVLQLKKKFYLTVNIVATPENTEFIESFSKICKQNKINLHIDPLVDEKGQDYAYSESQLNILSKYFSKDRDLKKKSDLKSKDYIKQCSAGRNYYNIMPNGEVSICSCMMDYFYSPMKDNIKNSTFILGNIFNDTFSLNKNDYICKYNCYNHCDMDYCSIKLIKRNKA